MAGVNTPVPVLIAYAPPGGAVGGPALKPCRPFLHRWGRVRDHTTTMDGRTAAFREKNCTRCGQLRRWLA